MKKLIILVVAVALLGGGGFFAWMQLGSESEDGGGFSLTASRSETIFVEMEPLTAPFIRDGKFAQYVVLVVNLEVASSGAEDKVRKRMPKLRDAFVSELHSLAARRPPNQKLINIARIKARLLAGADQVMGSGVVRDILVQLAH